MHQGRHVCGISQSLTIITLLCTCYPDLSILSMALSGIDRFRIQLTIPSQLCVRILHSSTKTAFRFHPMASPAIGRDGIDVSMLQPIPVVVPLPLPVETFPGTKSFAANDFPKPDCSAKLLRSNFVLDFAPSPTRTVGRVKLTGCWKGKNFTRATQCLAVWMELHMVP